MITIIEYINISGSFVFAVSGALIAMKRKLDPFGVLIVSFITAVGGGTLRDILIDREIFWLYNTSILYAVFLGSIVAMIFKSNLNFFDKPMFFYDALGLGLFTITGVQIGLENNLDYLICIILGTVTGVFGGVLRDVVVNKIPVVFKKEIYATASILGGLLYIILMNCKIPNPYLQIIPIFFIILIRLGAVYFNVSLPSIYKDKFKHD
ncbi:trimeric intracellular cation channel family protein [Wenyingzhuangia sp. 2_MG-2023]|uniref:trimeric intracellular cation channel family protein n=1 Tax=Wenyingzhuangia sp. 2_MG-2023 TaxID=3062639 RepID=UPI0026E3DF58|nr:trimeric intracellular cation channel family protein [Wenyingzhuangia sp. 2_MG-2023]MDO6736801.1 trimeric intracellular cation channel family protein [Wenyingzhuangia sp. 2_MG-2023]MDO6800903.1 trimeric intracellular cation channel family protein [Wenyingzhuangia sp. 1_MG-2023]